jgi:hypothetical protein
MRPQFFDCTPGLYYKAFAMAFVEKIFVQVKNELPIVTLAHHVWRLFLLHRRTYRPVDRQIRIGQPCKTWMACGEACQALTPFLRAAPRVWFKWMHQGTATGNSIRLWLVLDREIMHSRSVTNLTRVWTSDHPETSVD